MYAHVQIYSSPGRAEPRVKASQCFTKYKWRDIAAAQRESGPQIVATQVGNTEKASPRTLKALSSRLP